MNTTPTDEVVLKQDVLGRIKSEAAGNSCWTNLSGAD